MDRTDRGAGVVRREDAMLPMAVGTYRGIQIFLLDQLAVNARPIVIGNRAMAPPAGVGNGEMKNGRIGLHDT